MFRTSNGEVVIKNGYLQAGLEVIRQAHKTTIFGGMIKGHGIVDSVGKGTEELHMQAGGGTNSFTTNFFITGGQFAHIGVGPNAANPKNNLNTVILAVNNGGGTGQVNGIAYVAPSISTGTAT